MAKFPKGPKSAAVKESEAAIKRLQKARLLNKDGTANLHGMDPTEYREEVRRALEEPIDYNAPQPGPRSYSRGAGSKGGRRSAPSKKYGPSFTRKATAQGSGSGQTSRETAPEPRDKKVNVSATTKRQMAMDQASTAKKKKTTEKKAAGQATYRKAAGTKSKAPAKKASAARPKARPKKRASTSSISSYKL